MPRSSADAGWRVERCGDLGRSCWRSRPSACASAASPAADRATFERDVVPLAHPARAATPGPATARPGARTGSSSRCSGSTPTSTTRPSPGRPGGAGSSPPRPSRACCSSRPRRRSRTAAAGSSRPGSPSYQTLLGWIADGMPRTPADAPRLVRIAVEPAERTLAPGEGFALRVTATYSDGSTRDVTAPGRVPVDRPDPGRGRPRGPGQGRADPRRGHRLGPVPGDVRQLPAS